MKCAQTGSSSKSSHWAKPVLASAALAAMAFAGGCTVHVHDSDPVVYHQRRVVQPQPEPVVVEQPAPEPVAEVVYEPAPVVVVNEYEPVLSPYGRWVTIGAYGRCWVYNNRPAGWRPYTYGHWVATDQGWLWVAEGEEAQWGQTCYHYGRWYEDPAEGWVWVPGRVWGPSWCAWREGGGYSSWAPLPPECGDGHVISVAVVDHYVRPERYVSCRTENITQVNIHKTVIVNNVTIVNKTTNITNITYVNNRAVNRGVPVNHVESASGHKVKVTKTVQVKDAEEARRQIAAGKPVMYTPAGVESYALTHPITKREEHKDIKAVERNDKGEIRDAKENAIVEKKENKTNEKIETIEERAARQKAELDRKTEVKDARENAIQDKKDNKAADKVDVIQEREAKQKAEQDRMAQEKIDKERIATEKINQERAAKENALQEKMAREKAVEDQKAAEKASKEKIAADKLNAERQAKEQAAQEKMAREKAAEDLKLAKEKAASDKITAEREAKEKAVQDKAAALREAKDKAAADKAARESKNDSKQKADNNNDPKKKPKNGDNNNNNNQ